MSHFGHDNAARPATIPSSGERIDGRGHGGPFPGLRGPDETAARQVTGATEKIAALSNWRPIA